MTAPGSSLRPPFHRFPLDAAAHTLIGNATLSRRGAAGRLKMNELLAVHSAGRNAAGNGTCGPPPSHCRRRLTSPGPPHPGRPRSTAQHRVAPPIASPSRVEAPQPLGLHPALAATTPGCSPAALPRPLPQPGAHCEQRQPSESQSAMKGSALRLVLLGCLTNCSVKIGFFENSKKNNQRFF